MTKQETRTVNTTERCNAFNVILRTVHKCITSSKNQALKEELREVRELILNQYWKD